MKKYIIPILVGSLVLTSCGSDEKGSADSTDNPSKTVSLENQNDRFSYALGMNAGINIRTTITNPQMNIAEHVFLDDALAAFEDGITGEYRLSEDDMQRVINMFIENKSDLSVLTEEQKRDFSYVMGMDFSMNIKNKIEMYGATEIFNQQAFLKGVTDAIQGQPTDIPEEDHIELIQNFFNDRQADVEAKMRAEIENDFAKYKAEGDAFLAENAKRPEVLVTPTGLQYEVLKQGTGARPKATSKVKVHYHGTLIDGTVFDSSVERGEPITFGLNQVIPGWTEGVQLMTVGSKYRFYIPTELAYGRNVRPNGDIKAGMTLIFDVELLGIE